MRPPVFTDRLRSMTVRYSVHGGSTPRYLPPGQGTYPPPRSRWGYPKVPTPHPGPDGGVPRGAYPPARSQWGRGYPKVPTSLARYRWEGEGVPQGTYPLAKVPTPFPQDSTADGVLDTPRSVHAGGLSC